MWRRSGYRSSDFQTSGSRSSDFRCSDSRHVLSSILLLVASLIATCQGFCEPDSNGMVNLSGKLNDTKIDSHTFSACLGYIDNITKLDLSYNDFESIDEGSFYTFYRLEHLNLSHNNIDNMSKNSFLGLRNLQVLHLDHNKLERLEAGTFDLVKLVEIHVNNNNISEVEPGIVSSTNVNLLHFDISHNSLTYMDPWPYLTYQSNVRSIDRIFDIRYNKITSLTNYMNWTYNLKYAYEVHVYAQYNELETASLDMLRQYDPQAPDDSLFPMLLTFYMNITNNDFVCDCRTYNLANAVRGGLLRYSRVEEFRYRCGSPAHLKGSDFLHDTPLHHLVCNHTTRCPANCFCQERPHDGILLVNCTNAGLTALPKELPETRTPLNIELHLDHNEIRQLEKRDYLSSVSRLSVANNRIDNLDSVVLGALDNATHVNLANNQIETLPKNVQKFDSIKLTGNPLICDCKSMWIKQWMEVDVNNADSELKCTSSENNDVLTILSMTERSLGCTDDLPVILGCVFGVILAIVIVVLIFAYRCPYETKVYLHKYLSVHVWDNPSVDKSVDKDVDIYLVFDERDRDVTGYIRYFVHVLNKQKPLYSVLNPQRFTEGGGEMQNVFKYIGKSKRVIVFLSKDIFKNATRMEEIDDAEHRQIEEIETNGGRNVTPADIQLQEAAHATSIEQVFNTENAPKIIYVIYNDDKKLVRELKREPWKTRLVGKTVLKPDPDDKMFWPKIRYELPRTGNGQGDGTYNPFGQNRVNVRRNQVRPRTPENPKRKQRQRKDSEDFDNVRIHNRNIDFTLPGCTRITMN